MTLVNVKTPSDLFPFTGLLNNFVTGFPTADRSRSIAANERHAVAVNVLETEDSFQLQVVAPGFAKEDFKIDLDKNLLTISVQTKSENAEKAPKYIRNEYTFNGFKRSFTVDEKINTENISAEYVNGILSLNLPKQVEVKQPVKQITIA